MTLLQNLMLLLLGRLSIRGATLVHHITALLYEKAGNVWWWLSLVTVNILLVKIPRVRVFKLSFSLWYKTSSPRVGQLSRG
jgi:hypothetical protein